MGPEANRGAVQSDGRSSMRNPFGWLIRFLDRPAGISIGRLATQSLSLITAPIIAQAIGPAGRGLTAAAIAAVTIAGVTIGLGVPLAVRRRAVLVDDRADLLHTARVFAWLTVLPSLGIGGILAMTVLAPLDPEAKLAFLVAMACAGLTVSWVIDTQVLVADRRYFRILWLGSIQTVAYFSVILVLWLFHAMSVAAVLWAYTAGTLAAFLLGRWWVRSRGGRVVDFRALVSEGARLWGSQAAEVASARLDQLLVLPIIGAGPAGLYSVAVTIGALPVSIGIGIGAASFRGFVENGTRARISEAIRAAIALVLLLASVVAVVSIWGIPFLFGPSFAGSVPLAFVALGGSVAVVGNYICSMALVGQNRGLRMTVVQLIGLAVGIGLLFPAGAVWGAMGAAIASAAGYLATLVGSLVALRMPILDVVPTPRDFHNGLRLFFRSN